MQSVSGMSPRRVLIVANQTANSPDLLSAVAERAACGPRTFMPLVPASPHGLHRVVDPEDHGIAVPVRRGLPPRALEDAHRSLGLGSSNVPTINS